MVQVFPSLRPLRSWYPPRVFPLFTGFNSVSLGVCTYISPSSPNTDWGLDIQPDRMSVPDTDPTCLLSTSCLLWLWYGQMVSGLR